LAVEYLIAVIGSGPAGMSAAARAAKRGLSHILLERMSHLTDTVHSYGKRKHVMASPHLLPVRSDLEFAPGAREDVLEFWGRGVADAHVNVRFNAEVRSITGERGRFEISLADGDRITAAHVVLAVGTQGKPRALGIPGAELPLVRYKLDDPDNHCGETIVVIGAGDSAIEDALAVAADNEVIIVNRRAQFRSAGRVNAARIRDAVARGLVTAIVNATPKRIGAGHIVLDTEQGEALVACDRIIARLGTLPPREFLEACGLEASEEAYPPISGSYESQIPGLYIIGALAGYPLIKQGLQQGYEVVEHIIGNSLPPVDESLLKDKLRKAGVAATVAEFVAHLRRNLPLFAGLAVRQIREFLVHADLRRSRTAEVIFKRSEYTNDLHWIIEGQIALENAGPIRERICFGRGEFIGALDFVSGRPRATTAIAMAPSLLITADRRSMAILFRAAPEIRRAIEEVAVARQIRLHFAPGISDAAIAELVRTARIDRFKAGETLIEEGATDDPIYIIRKGSVVVSRRLGGKDVVLAYLPAGTYVGEIASLTGEPAAAVIATTATEAIRIDRAVLQRVLETAPQWRRDVARTIAALARPPAMTRQRSGLVEFLIDQGVGEATDLLFIDQSLCIDCNNCETACAETHGGLSALQRMAGTTYGTHHLANACRHCEQPHCMADCPTDSIRRGADGAIFIDDSCTGCGNCERNCPYGAIRMAALPERKPGLLAWLLFGWGSGPGEHKSEAAETPCSGHKHPVKCDRCRNLGTPACVSSCPTGAAFRISPEAFIASTLKRNA
jgi:thioredoxin reductase/Fe-S-cluster-containing hydrogenase component 2/CRP-like cAMP-binding protein